MELTEGVLESIGLTKNESKVYLSILRLGSASAGEVTNNSGVHRRNVYDSIERLMKKGLVGHVTRDKIKYFEVSDPNNLRTQLQKQKDEIKQKEELLDSVLPQLLVTKNGKQSEDVKIFRGKESRKIIFEDILNTGKDNCVLGAHTPSKLSQPFMKKWHRRRVDRGIKNRLIYNKPDPYSEEVSRFPLTEVRFMPHEIDTKSAINIYGNKVAMLLWSNDQPITILIDNKNIADDFRAYFNVLWNKSKKSV